MHEYFALWSLQVSQCNCHLLSGFNAYVGYLLLEHTHANPVLVTFCQLLIKTMNDRQASEDATPKDLLQNNSYSSKFMFTNRFFKSSKVVHHILVLRQPRESLIL